MKYLLHFLSQRKKKFFLKMKSNSNDLWFTQIRSWNICINAQQVNLDLENKTKYSNYINPNYAWLMNILQISTIRCKKLCYNACCYIHAYVFSPDKELFEFKAITVSFLHLLVFILKMLLNNFLKCKFLVLLVANHALSR